MFAKLGNGTVRDLTLDTNTVYTHPSTKQCNYSYVHPASKQCTWTPDSSNFYVTGTYTGDGNSSRTIWLGFTPKAVFLITAHGLTITSFGEVYGGLANQEQPAYSSTGNTIVITVNGFIVYRDEEYSRTNYNGNVYNYIAFR